MDKEEIKEIRRCKFKTLIDEFKGNQTSFALFADMNPSFVTQIKKGDRTLPNEIARSLESLFNKPYLWMDQKAYDVAEPLANYNVSRVDFKKVPILTAVQAGNWREAVLLPEDDLEMVLCPYPVTDGVFAFRVTNDSMTSPVPGQKSYPHGSVVFADSDRPAKSGDRVIATIKNHKEATFKVYKEDMGIKKLVPINYVSYDAIDVTHLDFEIAAVIIGKYEPE